jgi:SAM-dependent methyltransferase
MTSTQLPSVQANWPEHGLESAAACPVCGERRRTVLHDGLRDRIYFCAPGAWTLYRCGGCGSGYLDPRPTLATIGLAYSDYYTHGLPPDITVRPSGWRRRWHRALRNGYLNARYGYDFQPANRFGPILLSLRRKAESDRIVRHLRRPSQEPKLLDLGCGNGAFLAQMRDAGWEVAGLEPDPKSVAAAARAGLPVKAGLLEESTFPEDHFDAITLSHVIEHLHDPVATLKMCRRVLKPSGVIWVATPNLASLGYQIYGRDWFALDPPRHLILFTPDSLRGALRSAGFEVSPKLQLSFEAKIYYRASLHLARGADPVHPPRLPFLPKLRVNWQAKLSDWRTLVEPEVSEELIVLAHKVVGTIENCDAGRPNIAGPG